MLTESALEEIVIRKITLLDERGKLNYLKISFFYDGTFLITCKEGLLGMELFSKIQDVLKPIAKKYKSAIVDGIYTVVCSFSPLPTMQILVDEYNRKNPPDYL